MPLWITSSIPHVPQATHLHSGFGWPGVMSPWWAASVGPGGLDPVGSVLWGWTWECGFQDLRAEHTEIHSHSLSRDAYFLWITAERMSRGEGSPVWELEQEWRWAVRGVSSSTEELTPVWFWWVTSPDTIQLLHSWWVWNCLTFTQISMTVNTILSRAGWKMTWMRNGEHRGTECTGGSTAGYTWIFHGRKAGCLNLPPPNPNPLFKAQLYSASRLAVSLSTGNFMLWELNSPGVCKVTWDILSTAGISTVYWYFLFFFSFIPSLLPSLLPSYFPSFHIYTWRYICVVHMHLLYLWIHTEWSLGYQSSTIRVMIIVKV